MQSEVPEYSDIVTDPSRIWNADESGFPLSVERAKVLAEKGSRYVYTLSSDNHVQITVLACLSASGMYMPPFIVFKGERKRNCNMNDFSEAIFSSSKKGWMDSDTFLAWCKHFSSYLLTQNVKLPIILFLDGHSSHLSYEVATFCKSQGIILYCLPPHSSHAMQPLDVGVFGPMKAAWHKALKEWHWENPGVIFGKGCFTGLFKKVWDKSTTEEKAAQGFLRSGLYPLDPMAVNLKRLRIEAPENEQRSEHAEVQVLALESPLVCSVIPLTTYPFNSDCAVVIQPPLIESHYVQKYDAPMLDSPTDPPINVSTANLSFALHDTLYHDH